LASVQQIITNEIAAAGVTPDAITVYSSAGNNNPGVPSDTVKISVQTTVPLLTGYIAHYFVSGTGKYVFTLSISFKNESFSPLCSAPPYTGC
jgi:hypothetical protein